MRKHHALFVSSVMYLTAGAFLIRPKYLSDHIDETSTAFETSDVSVSSPEISTSSEASSSPTATTSKDSRKILQYLETSQAKLRREMQAAEAAKPDSRPLGYPFRPSFIGN